MAGDWIPYSKDLPRKPEVLRLAAALGTSTYEVVGLLLAVWSWADDQTTDGLLPGLGVEHLEAAIDVTPLLRSRDAGVTLAASRPLDLGAQLLRGLVEVGWLVVEAGGVRVPNFDFWMGSSAKKRLQTAARMRRLRSGDAAVTRRASRERHQRRGEESISNTPLTPPVPKAAEGPAPRRPALPCDAPERAGEARGVVEHYLRQVRPEQTGRAAAVPLVLDLLLAGRSAAELRRAADGYAAWCARHDRAGRHRKGPKAFFAFEGDWQEFLAGDDPGPGGEAADPARKVSGHVRAVVAKLTEISEGRYRDRQAAPGAGLTADGAPDLPWYERRYWRELAEARRAGVELPWLAGREPAGPAEGGAP